MNFLKSIFGGRLKERIAELERHIDRLDHLLNERGNTIVQLIHERDQLTAHNDQLTSQLESSNLENSNLWQKNAELQTEKNVLIRASNDATARITEKERENTELSECLRAKNNELETLGNTLKDLHEELSRLSEMISEKDSLVESLTAETESLNEEKQGLLTKIDDIRAHASEEINALKDEIEQKQGLINSLKSDNVYKSDEVTRLSELVSEKESNIETLTSDVKSLEVEKQELLTKIEEIKNSHVDEELVKALREEIKKNQDNISNLETDVQRLNEELSISRKEKKETDALLYDSNRECEDLKKELRSLQAQITNIGNLENELMTANKRIDELKNALKNAPKLNDLIELVEENEKLKSEKKELESKLHGTENSQQPEQPPTKHQPPVTPKEDKPDITDSPKKQKKRYKRPEYPYSKRPVAPSEIVKTVDFPVIENDNIYTLTSRLIDKVFNHRSNSLISADEIFLRKSAEEISKMRFDLEEAYEAGVPYLTCPSCGCMVKISSRRVGFGVKNREVQFFTHAVKNIHCDLKRDNYYDLTIEEGEKSGNDYSYLNELRSLLANSLRTDISLSKGVSDVEEKIFIFSNELTLMKRRQADVTARYNDKDLVFELVTPTTHIARVRDRDLFYLINRKQVFWLFGLESIVDYNELRRSVAKDILFTNKRNVFVFDLEAQEESIQRGELILKCNWLDEDDNWHYQIDKNGTNGYLISLDQIHFDDDGCRPYFYDADETFYLKNPTAERPFIPSREQLKKDIEESWRYDQERKRAFEQMQRENRGVEAFFDGNKWGFKFGNTVFIKPLFDSEPIIEGVLAKVEKDGKYGVVNRFGEYRLKAEYERVEILPNGRILYSETGKWYLYGVIDPLAKFLSTDKVTVNTISEASSIYHLIIKQHLFVGQQPEEFYFIGDEIFRKNNGTGKWSLWQSNGEEVTDVTWDTFELTPEDTIKVSINGRTLTLALDGSVIKEQKYKTETKLPNGNLIVESFDGNWGIIDSKDNEIISPLYECIISLNGNYLKYKKGIGWGIMTAEGTVLCKPEFRTIDRVDGDTFEVSKTDLNKGWGYVSGKVNQHGQPVPEIVSSTEFGYNICKFFEQFGCEKDGKILIPYMYNSLSFWGGGYFIAQKNKKYGIINSRNEVIVDFECLSISPLKDGRSTIVKIGSKYDVDSNLKMIEDAIINLQDGYKKMKINGKWGILDPEGNIIVNYLYDEISTFRGRLIGIINNRLVKLNAYYPYRLSMKAVNLGLSDSKYLLMSGGVKFQLFRRRIDPPVNQETNVVLINWGNSMKYPVVNLSEETIMDRRARHIDKPSDFEIGDSFEVMVDSFLMNKRGSRKGTTISLPNNSMSYIYKPDFIDSNLDINEVSIGERFIVTKIGYDEELDRTLWKVKKIDD